MERQQDSSSSGQHNNINTDDRPVFIREQIKEHPVNRKKLIRRTLITVSMAVLFGLVSCITFLLIEPYVSRTLNPEQPVIQVTFPEKDEEILPEDLPYDDAELYHDNEGDVLPEETTEKPDIKETLAELTGFYRTVTADVRQSLVTVVRVRSDVDWFDNVYEAQNSASGLAIAFNGREYLILSDMEVQDDDDDAISVVFSDGTSAQASVKASDRASGLAVIAVKSSLVPDRISDRLTIATLGTTNGGGIVGTPVIALGRPLGIKDSVCYGCITSGGSVVDTVDSVYGVMTTDILSGEKGSGFICNLKGQIIGVITDRYRNEVGPAGCIRAYGISDLRFIIEKLSNGNESAYFGVHATEVTEEINESHSIPFGICVKSIELDSPAMKAGIQSGDVITRIGDDDITDCRDLMTALSEIKPDTSIDVAIMRKHQGEYTEMVVSATMGSN